MLLYYLLPVKVRFIAPLFANAYFLYKCDSPLKLCVWFFTALLTYGAAIFIHNAKSEGSKRGAAYVSVATVAALMILLRNGGLLQNLNAAPTGISYYSLFYISYILECYYGTHEPEKNPFKFFTFAGCFLMLTSGPVLKASDSDGITSPHKFEFRNIIFGLERILWGFMKKLIIADRISVLVDTVYNVPYAHNGLYIWIATAAFAIQLYTDFSGCIDIVLGGARLFGITLPENFNYPFISETLSEFWRRWHITLGGFLRDYILYPILKSKPFQALGKFSKKHFGKKIGKKIPVWIGLMISWTLVGYWHGGYFNYTFGVGIWFGFIIVMGEILEPFFKKLTALLRINTEAFSWKLFRIVRTWFFFGTGMLFFRAHGFRNALLMIKLSVASFNPWIFFDGSMYELGLDVTDWHILAVFLGIVAITGLISFYKKQTISELLSHQNLLFQWALIILLIYSIVIYGCYGVGFDSQSFIYQGF